MMQSDGMMVFDRALVRRRRDRAAPGLAGHNFLFEHVAAMLADRLLDLVTGQETELKTEPKTQKESA